VQTAVIQRLVNYCDPEHSDGADAKPRTVIGAVRAIAALCGLSLKQQQLDLARQKLEGVKPEISLADLVAKAEKRAERRREERASVLSARS
jgi:hypothetical protein